MRARRSILTVLTAGIVALGTTAAFASGPPYTLKVGTSTSGTYTLTGASTGGSYNEVEITLKTGPGWGIGSIYCKTATFNGSVTAGAGLTTLFKLTSSSWPTCIAAGGSYTSTSYGTWSVVGTGATASTGSTDVIAGKITGFGMKFVTNVPVGDGPDYSVCTFRISGSPRITFTETSSSTVRQKLAFAEPGYSSAFAITSNSGCYEYYPVGTQAGIKGNVDLGPASQKISVS